MKLEQQVCSLELAKKLKELGVKQDSLFYWEVSTSLIFYEKRRGEENFMSAFTVAELGEMLPFRIDLPDVNDIYWGIREAEYVQDKDVVGYGRYGFEVLPDALCVHIGNKGGVINSEADARAKMLIYLLENKLI